MKDHGTNEVGSEDDPVCTRRGRLCVNAESDGVQRRQDRVAGASKMSWIGDDHRTECWLTSGSVEIDRIGDIVSGPRMVVAQEPLVKVLFLYLVDGAARVTLADVGVQVLSSNDALVLFPGRVVSVELTDPSNGVMLVALRGREAVNASLNLGFWDLMRFSVRYTGNYMAEIIERFHAAPLRGRDPHVQGMVEQLLETIWLHARNCSGRGEVFDAVRMVNRCPVAELTTDSMASALGISRSKLNVLFLSGLGMRPGEYLTQVILAQSLALLFWTRLSVAQVASKMGFSSASAFAAFLRRCIGRTPAAFRKKPIVIAP